MHDALAVADEAFAGSRTVSGARTTVFKAGPRRSPRAQAAAAVANELASRWLVEVQRRALGAEAFAHNVTGLARKHGLALTGLAYRAIAECFEQEGRRDRALSYYAKAAAAAPDDPDTLNSYGASLGRARQYRKSVRVLREAQAIHPRDAMILTNLGLSLSEIGKTAEALAAVEAALALDPTYARAWVARAVVRRRLGSPDQAIEDAIRAQELEPSWSWTWGLLAGLNVELKRWDDALVALDRADALEPPTPWRLLFRAASSMALGRLGATAEALRGLDAHPDAPSLRNGAPEAAALESEIRRRLDDETRLTPLIDSIPIDLPPDVDFSDWKQLSAYLMSREA